MRKTFKITYEPRWAKLKYAFTTEVKGENEEEAKQYFMDFYPQARLKSITEIKS